MKHKTLRTLLCVILTVCFCLSAIAPVSAAGLFSGDTGAASIFDEWIRSLKDRFTEKNPGTDETPAEPMAGAGNDFIRIFHLDCGRKYFTVAEIEGIIDQLAANHYTHIELAFGNDGFRFLLDDMSVGGYTSDQVKSAIQVGNSKDHLAKSSGTLSETDMNTIIAYAQKNGIGVIPMIDVPGHTNTLIFAMNELGFNLKENTDYKNTNKNNAGNKTYAFKVSGDNGTANAQTQFVVALVKKYVDYFAQKDSAYFNIGADECGYDGFVTISDLESYLLNPLAEHIVGQNMKPMIFNDGFRSGGLDGSLNSSFIVCYWEYQDGYKTPVELMSASYKVINTHNKWYYVAGNSSTSTSDSNWFGYGWALNNINKNYRDCTACDNSGTTETGCMLAYWCDNPAATYDEAEKTRVYTLIQALANKNPDYFKAPVTPTITVSANSLTVGGTATLSTSDGSLATWASSDEKVLEVVATKDVVVATKDVTAASVTVRAVGAGTATVTAKLSDGTTLTSETITVRNQGEVTYEERTVTVTEGQTLTLTETISGQHDGTQENEFANVVAESREVAGETTYTKKGLPIAGESAKYYISSNKNDSSPTIEITIEKDTDENYYLKNAKGQYIYPTYNYNNGYTVATSNTKKSVNISGDVSNGFIISCDFVYYRDTYQAYLTISNGNLSSNYNSQILYLYEQKTTPAGYETVVTVTGKKVTTAPVEMIVGTVKYLITVTAEDLSSVTPLPISLWFTNCDIEVVSGDTNYTFGQTSDDFVSGSWQDNKKPYYISVPAGEVNSAEGKNISQILPNKLLRYENSNTYWEAAYTGKVQKELVLWSGAVHTKTDDNIQLISGTDYSNSGTEFKYVRYYGATWAVSADRVNWDPILGGTGSTASFSSCTEQVAVYYMMRSTITEEVTTDVADWGYVKKDKEYATEINSGNYVMLDFAVKYEDGTRNPNTFPQDGKTFVFHCTPNDASGVVKQDSSGNYYRQLNNFRGVNTSDFEIYKVTVTMTGATASDTLDSTTSYDYVKSTEQIVWAIDEATRTASGLEDYVSISGADSVYSGCTIGGDPYVRGVEVYNKHGALITYYIRAKVMKDSLTVNYFVDGAAEPFYHYNINVDTNKEESTFKLGIALDTTTDTSWKGKLVDGDVVNIKNQRQWVSADLGSMPEIGAQYRFSNYMCVRVDRVSEKIVNLYYRFEAKASFVVDFGLPIIITPADLNADLATSANITGAIVSDTLYAKITVEGKNIIYTLNKPLDRVDTFTIKYVGTNLETSKEGDTTYDIKIYPATNVYYEENFINVAENSTVWTDTGTARNPDQALEKSDAQKNVYGYDPVYATATDTYSMGNAKKATLTLSADAFSTKTSEALTFTFEGDGYDIISECGTDVGLLVAYTYRVENGKETLKYIDIMDNYFCGDDTYITGTDILAAQVPVIRKLNLSDGYGKYKVKIIGYLRQTAGVLNVSDTMAAQSYAAMASVDSPVVYDYESSTNAIVDEILADLGVANLADVDVRVSFVDKNSILNGGTGVFAKETVQDMKNDLRSAYTVQANGGYKAGSAVVYVDAFRVYNPLGHDTTNLPTAYNDNRENSLKYESMYDYLKNSGSAVTNNELVDNALIYVEYDGDTNVATVKDYKNQGPDNEIYLTAEQNKANYIGIILQGWTDGNSKVMVSAKSVLGNPALWVKTQSSQYKVADVKTKTELYYDLSDFVKWDSTIKNWVLVMSNQSNSQSVLSISGIKISKDCSAGSSQFFAESVKDSLTSTGTSTYNPDPFSVTSYGNVLSGDEVSLNVKVDGSANSLKLYDSDGKEIAAHFSWNNQKAYNRGKVTFKSFTIYFDAPMVTTETAFTYKVVAVNADGIESNPIEITITVVQ